MGLRLILGLATLFAITLITFLATNLLPGDPSRQALGRFSTPLQRAEFRERQGLDRPVLQRYSEWLGNIAAGDWGASLVNNRDVGTEVRPRVLRSMTIALLGFLVALPIAVGLGGYAAMRSGRPADVILSTLAVVVASLPEFVVAIALLIVVAVQLSLLPVTSTEVLVGDPAGYVLPTLALAAVTIPYLFRMVRANVRDVLSAPYVSAAHLRGIYGWRLTSSHIAPNAALPLVNAVTLSLAELLGGIVVIEYVFGFPGAGQLLVEAIKSGDVPVIQVLAIVIGGSFVILNAIADVTVAALDPRQGGA